MSRQPKPRPPLDAATRAFCEEQTVALLPLIGQLARKSRLPFPIEDLVQEGAWAAYEALPRFDATRGVKLQTWIAPRIFGAMRDYARSVGRFTKGGGRQRREHVVSLQALRYQTDTGKGQSLLDELALPSPRATADWRRLLRGFSRAERIIVLEYFVHGSTMKSIAISLGLSESRVSQWMTTILDRLRRLEASERRVTEAIA
jgi:RNA polymerase sigma factor (sigma-70 family)